MVIVAVDFCRVFSESRSDSGRRRRGSTNIGNLVYSLICAHPRVMFRIFEKYEKLSATNMLTISGTTRIRGVSFYVIEYGGYINRYLNILRRVEGIGGD